MKSLDQILSEEMEKLHGMALSELTNLETWTSENRDLKLINIRELIDSSASSTLHFIKDLIEKDLEGKSLLEWKFREQLLVGLLDILYAIRSLIDETEPGDLPVDYEFVNGAIRDTLKSVAAIQTKLYPAIDDRQDTEEEL